jgi:hypothetical protein
MTVQHADLFHCLACGRVAYEPHGGVAPDCCGQPMVRAVEDVVKDVPASPAADPGGQGGGEIEDHALFAEVVELSQWCHQLRDVDISRSEELANRLSVLHQALIDQFEDPPRGDRPLALAEKPRASIVADHSQGQGQQLLAMFSRFVAQLRSGPLPFVNWAQICDRLDELVGEFRQYAQIDGTPSREASVGENNSAH